MRTFDELARIRPIVLRLLHVWLEGPQRYEEGWSDEHLAGVLGADAGEVSFVRRAAFGAEAEAGELWRIRQAIELLEEHHDDTARQGHRDALVQAEGLPALQAALRTGTAPAGGRYEGGWSDDRIAELTGLAPGLVTRLRATIPWVAPDARAERQRQRRAARLFRPTRAGRALRLAEELHPRTRKPYTADQIADALLAAGEQARTPAARAALVAWIESTVRVGQLRLATHPTKGTPYTLDEIAARVGASKQAVSKILKRFDDETAGPRVDGRPSHLTNEVIERVAIADAADVDPAKIGTWLVRRLWPRAPKGDRASQARKIRGWRQAGAAALEAGDLEAPAARFEAAVRRLINAPGSAPKQRPRAARRKEGMTRNDEENARKFACPRCGAAAGINCRGIAAGRVHMERLHVARAADRAKTPAEALERMSADLRRLLAEIGPGDQLKQQTAGAAMRWSRKLAAGGYLGAYLTRQVEEGERLGVLRRAAGSPPTMVLSEFGLTVQAAMREAA